jgi:hypothetical protein
MVIRNDSAHYFGASADRSVASMALQCRLGARARWHSRSHSHCGSDQWGGSNRTGEFRCLSRRALRVRR